MTEPVRRGEVQRGEAGQAWLASADEVQGFLDKFASVGSTTSGKEVRIGAVSLRKETAGAAVSWSWWREIGLTVGGLMVVTLDPEDSKVEGKLHRTGDCVATCSPFAAWSPDQQPPKEGPVSPGVIDVSTPEGFSPRDQVLRLRSFVGMHTVVEASQDLLRTGFDLLQSQGHRVPALAPPA